MRIILCYITFLYEDFEYDILLRNKLRILKKKNEIQFLFIFAILGYVIRYQLFKLLVVDDTIRTKDNNVENVCVYATLNRRRYVSGQGYIMTKALCCYLNKF